MASSVTGKVKSFTTMDRAREDGLIRPIFYASFWGAVSGTQPPGATPGLFSVDLTEPIGREIRLHILTAAALGFPCVVVGTGVLLSGHPSERTNNVTTDLPA